MNSNSITYLLIPTLPHETANKLYVNSNSRKILQGYVPPLRSMGGRNNIKLGFIATASSQLNNYYRACILWGLLNLGDGSRRQGILCGCDLQEVNKTKIVFVPQQYNIELRLEIRRHHRITSRRLPQQNKHQAQIVRLG